MKPTNYLRYLEKTRKVALNPGVFGDMRTISESYQVLQQFWEDDDFMTTLSRRTPTWDNNLQKFGEWREIELVKDD